MSSLRRNTDLKPARTIAARGTVTPAKTDAATTPMEGNPARPPVPLMAGLRVLAEQQQNAWLAALQGDASLTLTILGDLVSDAEQVIRRVREWQTVSREMEA